MKPGATCGKLRDKKMEIYTFIVFACVCVCVGGGPKSVCVHEYVHMYVCDVSVCHTVSSFPFTAP